MKTKTIEVCDAIMINITCALNDEDDIKCGGPTTLGYEFYVNPDENKDELVQFVKGCLNKYNRPLLYIDLSIKHNFPVDKLWTSQKIHKTIKDNAVA